MLRSPFVLGGLAVGYLDDEDSVKGRTKKVKSCGKPWQCDLIFADMNQQRRQAMPIAIHGRDQGRAAIAACDVSAA